MDLDLDITVPTLSQGNRQKLVLVVALTSRQELLILDEPTGRLDPLRQRFSITAALVQAATISMRIVVGFNRWDVVR